MRLNPYFSLKQIGWSSVLIPSGESGWKSHGVIPLDDQEAIIVQHLIKEISKEELVIKLEREIECSKDELNNMITNVIDKLRSCGVLNECIWNLRWNKKAFPDDVSYAEKQSSFFISYQRVCIHQKIIKSGMICNFFHNFWTKSLLKTSFFKRKGKRLHS